MTILTEEAQCSIASQPARAPRRLPVAAHPPGPVLIVAENASAANGGEAAIPLTYFRLLRERGADAHLLVHERCRAELEALLPGDDGRMHFVPDTFAQRWLWRVSNRLPARLAHLAIGFVIQFITQLAQRRLAKRLVAEHGFVVVHQPTPVSPRMPSMMHSLGAPVIIGPMNGGMSFPSAFRSREHALTRWSIGALRRMSNPLHALMPGKRRAAILLVANERTRDALPRPLRTRTMQLCENGVDRAIWRPRRSARDGARPNVRFVFSGRLAELKGVDLLLEATARAQQRISPGLRIELDILGDGDVTTALMHQAATLGLNGSVRFLGWQQRSACAAHLAESDVFVMPSLCECGGAVVLEAMAVGLPVIAAKWGGLADYVDASCGMLVEPTSREAFIAGFADAMVRLAESPSLCRLLGEAGQRTVEARFDWDVRIDEIVSVYHRAAQVPVRRPEKRLVRARHQPVVTPAPAARSAA